MNFLIWLLPLPPLLAFFAIILFTNKNKALSHGLAVGAAGLSWLGSMVVFVRAVGTQEFRKAFFRIGRQLVAHWEYLVPDRCAG